MTYYKTIGLILFGAIVFAGGTYVYLHAGSTQPSVGSNTTSLTPALREQIASEAGTLRTTELKSRIQELSDRVLNSNNQANEVTLFTLYAYINAYPLENDSAVKDIYKRLSNKLGDCWATTGLTHCPSPAESS